MPQHQLHQVVVNLITNARDELRRAPAPRRLTLRTRADTIRGRLSLDVEDTGGGIPDEIRDRIFEPFFTTKEMGKGTGLGLSTVYGIVKQHDGHIFVDSSSGQGTTFRIYLPVSMGERAVSKDEAASMMPRGTETVLVVEDDRAIRDLVGEILGPLGYRVLATASGEEAVARYGATDDRIHLLLTDVIMPDSGSIYIGFTAAGDYPSWSTWGVRNVTLSPSTA